MYIQYIGLFSHRSLKKDWIVNCPIAHHVNFVLIHHNTGAQQEGKHEFVLLKQAAAHIAVQVECEKFIDVGDSLLNYVCETRLKKRS